MTLNLRIISASQAAFRHQSAAWGRPRMANLWYIEPGNRVHWYKLLSSAPTSLVADASGNVIVGHTASDFTPRLTKYDSDGAELWTVTPSSSSTGTMSARSVDASGNIYAATLGTGANAFSAVYKFSAAGSELWRVRLLDGVTEYGTAGCYYDSTLNEVIASVGTAATTKKTLYRISAAGSLIGGFGVYASDSGSFTTSALILRATGGVVYSTERKTTGGGTVTDRLTAWSSPFTSADWQVAITSSPVQARVAVSGGYVFMFDVDHIARYIASSGVLDGTFAVGGFRAGNHEATGKLLLGSTTGSYMINRSSVLGVPDWTWGPPNTVSAIADAGSGNIAVAASQTALWTPIA